MKNVIRSLVALLIVIICPAVTIAGTLAGAPTVFRSGNWSVLRTTDAMTDATSCTGIYKDRYAIQLSKENLFVGIRGGLSSIRLRFDDEPAQNLRLATDIEKKVDSIVISGADFAKALDSRRLRVEALTLVSGVVNEDLDLTGMREAKANIDQGCPATGKIESAIAPAVGSVGLCPAKVVERLKARGLTEEATREVCKE